MTVTGPGGTTTTSAADHFSYAAAPTVTGVSPITGPGSGGTAVTITGTGFTGATAVDFGTAAATNVVVVNSGEITATSPTGTGQVDVTVVGPAGDLGDLGGGRVHVLCRYALGGHLWGVELYGRRIHAVRRPARYLVQL